MPSVNNNKRRRQIAEINVVPYIDVMLVLLIIFMVTAPMLNQGVEVDLPQTTSQPLTAAQHEPLIMTVDRDGRYFLNIGEDSDVELDTPTVLARVAAVLKHKPATPVLVKGDATVDYGQVVRAMALLQQAGAAKVGLMTVPAE